MARKVRRAGDLPPLDPHIRKYDFGFEGGWRRAGASIVRRRSLRALKQVEAGRTAEDVAREGGVSKHTIYAWKAKFRCMEASEVQKGARAGGRERMFEAPGGGPARASRTRTWITEVSRWRKCAVMPERRRPVWGRHRILICTCNPYYNTGCSDFEIGLLVHTYALSSHLPRWQNAFHRDRLRIYSLGPLPRRLPAPSGFGNV